MFSQVTRKIYGMENDISALSSRTAQCENDIYFIRHRPTEDNPLWNKVNDTEFRLNELIATIDTLHANVEEATKAIKNLSARLQEFEASICADPDATPAIPKQKIDLEISEQNVENNNGYVDIDLIDDRNIRKLWEFNDNWHER